MSQTRSAARAGVQLDWVGQVPVQGVGVRQERASLAGRGGGYLGECTPLQVLTDARLRELDEMGLPGIWLALAQSIGYDHFMVMWRLMDAEQAMLADEETMIHVKIRRYSSFKRYQRNRYVETLVAEGLSDTEIRQRIRCELGEDLSISHIGRLAGGRRVGSK